MQPTFSLFPITANDVDELRRLGLETFTESFAHVNTPEDMQDYLGRAFSREKLLEELLNPDSKYFYAIFNGTKIGYLKINYRSAQNEAFGDQAVELERIYVRKEYQGKKVGQYLIDQAIAMAREAHAKFIWLGVWEKNDGARRLYERNGFNVFSSHLFKLGEDIQTDILMKLDLNA